MKLSIDGIKDKTAWEEAGIKLPAYDVRKVAENTKKRYNINSLRIKILCF